MVAGVLFIGFMVGVPILLDVVLPDKAVDKLSHFFRFD